MPFSLSEIKKLASLAKISLSTSEMESLQGDLKKIVSYVEMLSEVDVTGVEPMEHAISTELFMRDDEVKPVLGRKGLENCAGNKDGLIQTPKIIE